jgi:hypothetical protein
MGCTACILPLEAERYLSNLTPRFTSQTRKDLPPVSRDFLPVQLCSVIRFVPHEKRPTSFRTRTTTCEGQYIICGALGSPDDESQDSRQQCKHLERNDVPSSRTASAVPGMVSNFVNAMTKHVASPGKCCIEVKSLSSSCGALQRPTTVQTLTDPAQCTPMQLLAI